jgi:glyoxylase-like metal-dependent hydrolase (beta-lactamase superfamily II)
MVEGFFDDASNTISYIVKDPTSKSCALIDSVLDFDMASGRTSFEQADKMIAYVEENQLEVEWILETHVHADHLSAAPYLKQKFGAKIGIGANITTVQEVFGKAFNAGTEFAMDGSQFDKLFVDGETFEIGALKARTLNTPGHTPACMTYVIGDAAFVGDTLFMPDFGTARTDFPGGSAEELYKSIWKILQLPSKTRLFMCHDYKAPGRDEFKWETTVQEQREANVHVKEGTSMEEFVAFRTERDANLSMPKLILPSVQVNMRAGQMPPAEEDGTSYLKIPINKF